MDENRKPKPQQDYKTGQGYIGMLQEARRAADAAESKRNIRKAAFERAMQAAEESSEEKAPGLAEKLLPSMTALLRKPWAGKALRWTARAVLLAAVAWQGERLRVELMRDELPPPAPEDVLVRIDENAPDFDGVKNYAQYIVNKTAAGGMEAIAGKWIDGVDPAFKSEAKAPLEALAGGFSFGEVSVDKAVVYNVECHPDAKPERSITIEVVKGRLSSGRAVYRLQRAY